MQTLITDFYTAFRKMDAEAMVSCYDDNVVFEDPAFGILEGERAKDMWRMLIASQKGKEFVITHQVVEESDSKASANWEAKYTFSKTGRKVHNIITAQFEIADGKIIKHTDHFDLHRWAGQAMGFSGQLIGWTGFFKKKLHKQTNNLLARYRAKNS
jgi:ketosteroid isomerase-like protein